MARYNLLGNDMQIVEEISSDESANELARQHVDGLRVVAVVPVEDTPEHIIPHHTGMEALDKGTHGPVGSMP